MLLYDTTRIKKNVLIWQSSVDEMFKYALT